MFLETNHAFREYRRGSKRLLKQLVFKVSDETLSMIHRLSNHYDLTASEVARALIEGSLKEEIEKLNKH